MTAFPKRLALWTLICSVSAAPSFIWGCMIGTEVHHITGMLTGVAIFILAYAWATGTGPFVRFKARHLVRRTLFVGYGARLLISIVFPVGLYIDLVCGMASTGLVGLVFPDIESYPAVLLTTLIQGVVLNIVLAIFMSLVWGIMRLVCGPPPAVGCCVQCGYDLRSSPSGICPECGLPQIGGAVPCAPPTEPPFEPGYRPLTQTEQDAQVMPVCNADETEYSAGDSCATSR